jgi:hypothetical protein
VAVDETHLHLAWLRSVDETAAQTMRASRKLYDEIARDEDGDWQPLREQLAGMYVDLERLLVVTEEAG